MDYLFLYFYTFSFYLNFFNNFFYEYIELVEEQRTALSAGSNCRYTIFFVYYFFRSLYRFMSLLSLQSRSVLFKVIINKFQFTVSNAFSRSINNIYRYIPFIFSLLFYLLRQYNIYNSLLLFFKLFFHYCCMILKANIKIFRERC